MEKIKRCSDCGRFLGESAFIWQKDARRVRGGYLSSYCRKCGRNRRWLGYQDTREKEMLRMKEWHREHKQHDIEYRKQYKQNNKDIINPLNAKRRAMRLNQTPVLSKEDKHCVEVLYCWAQLLPGEWHVDHVIPLNEGGLHHPDNLQLIPAKQNLEKSDKHPKEFYGRFNEFLTNIKGE